MKAIRSTAMLLTLAMVFTGFGLGLMVVSPQTAEAGGGYLFKGARQNASGGVTAGSRRVIRGAEGNYYRNGRGIYTDGSGNGSAWHSKGFHGPNGASANVAGGTTRSADGTLEHRNSRSYYGQNRTYTSDGTFSKNSEGQITANKNTSATAANGASYNGSTSYDPASGLTRTQVCTNQYGETVECP